MENRPFPPRLVALTIAGFDPSSGAGITADLKTFAAHGIYGMACISALTIQSTLGVRAVQAIPPDLVTRTLECLADDVSFSGIKIGMLGSAGVVRELSQFLARRPAGRERVVLDPVFRSSSGTSLLDAEGIRLVRQELLRNVGWITPNLDELRLLIHPNPPGRPDHEDNPMPADQVPAAAARLKDLAAKTGNDQLNIVVTGGHLSRPDDFLLTARGEEQWLPGERIATQATHGTGCAYSSALLCGLIAGQTPGEAAASAKDFVTQALRLAYPVGKGKGPINHYFSFET